jgi:hypothetical protein
MLFLNRKSESINRRGQFVCVKLALVMNVTTLCRFLSSLSRMFSGLALPQTSPRLPEWYNMPVLPNNQR